MRASGPQGVKHPARQSHFPVFFSTASPGWNVSVSTPAANVTGAPATQDIDPSGRRRRETSAPYFSCSTVPTWAHSSARLFAQSYLTYHGSGKTEPVNAWVSAPSQVATV